MFAAILSLFSVWGVPLPMLAKWLVQPLIGKIWVLLHNKRGFSLWGIHLFPPQLSIRGVTVP